MILLYEDTDGKLYMSKDLGPCISRIECLNSHFIIEAMTYNNWAPSILGWQIKEGIHQPEVDTDNCKCIAGYNETTNKIELYQSVIGKAGRKYLGSRLNSSDNSEKME